MREFIETIGFDLDLNTSDDWDKTQFKLEY